MKLLDNIKKFSEIKKDLIAVHSEENGVLSYAELERYSNRLAELLNNKVLDDKSPIIVYGHKDPYMVVAFLACVKSGHPYCPIDISNPFSRTKDIIDKVNPQIILALEPLAVEEIEAEVLLKNQIYDICNNSVVDALAQKRRVSEDDVFYIIFTSGSTGVPKGVQITAASLDSFLKWSVSLGDKELDDRGFTFINQAPFSFDLSVMDLYTCLYTGGTLCLLSKNEQGDMKKLQDSLWKSKANIWVSTPSFADLCMADEKFNANLMPGLFLFLFCGETLTNNTVQKLQERFPDAVIVNTYGPTESTVAVTDIIVTRELNKEIQPLPVGKAKPGTFIYIVDDEGNQLAEGIKGEIVIVGDTVSAGYYQLPQITEKAFHVYNINGKNHRGYRTGDEGYIKDGLLYYSGRIDLQIKLHGYRIEIEDVESNIMKIPEVLRVVVVPKTEQGKVKSLVAVVNVNFEVESVFRTSQYLRNQMKEFVPAYMIPQKFIFVDEFPMTSNGKINRKLLGGKV